MTPSPDNPLRERYNGMRACVTGGAGFIGGHLAEALLLLGARVTIIDDLSASDGEHAARLVESYPGQASFVYASILEPGAVEEAVDGCAAVFHLAAVTSVPRSLEIPERTFEVNAIGTLRVAEACRRSGVERLVYAASSSAYGDDPALPKIETMLPRPLSPYAASKLAGESVVRAWSHSYGLSGVSLRYFNVFGPRQPAADSYSAVVPAFITRLMAGRPPVVYGDGLQSRDFTPVANAVQATLLAGARPGAAVSGQVINVGCGGRTTVIELARTLARLTDRAGIEPEFRPARPGDVPHSVADITRARELLGYTPVRSTEEGLADTVAWHRSSGSLSAPPSALV